MDPIVLIVILVIVAGGAFYAYQQGLIAVKSSAAPTNTYTPPAADPPASAAPPGASRVSPSTYNDDEPDTEEEPEEPAEDELTVFDDDEEDTCTSTTTGYDPKLCNTPSTWCDGCGCGRKECCDVCGPAHESSNGKFVYPNLFHCAREYGGWDLKLNKRIFGANSKDAAIKSCRPTTKAVTVVRQCTKKEDLC